jgi:hypothetical protein
MAIQLGALAHEAEAGAEQVAQAAPLPGVGVGRREVAALEQAGDGLGVLAVALGLATVDGFHGPGVTEHEGDLVVPAGVREPVPGMHTLPGDEQAVAEGLHGAQERLRGGGQVATEADLAVAVEDDQVQRPGVEIDAAVEFRVGRGLEGAHEGLRVKVPREAAGCPPHRRK